MVDYTVESSLRMYVSDEIGNVSCLLLFFIVNCLFIAMQGYIFKTRFMLFVCVTQNGIFLLKGILSPGLPMCLATLWKKNAKLHGSLIFIIKGND